ncbi:MAG: hypothetical protein WCI77_02155 [Candidatus Omnitrophota bacterium]
MKNFIFASILLGTCLFLSSCVTCILDKNATELQKFYFQLNQNSEMLKNKSLNEVDPQFWQKAKTISVHIIYNDFLMSMVRGNVDAFSTVKTAALGGVLPVLITGPERLSNDVAFQDKITNFTHSYNWQAKDYFIEILKQEINLPKEANISFVTGEEETFPSIKTSDKDIIITLNLMMIGNQTGWGEPKAPLTAMAGVTMASGETIQNFIKKYNGLPLSVGPFSFVPDKVQLYSELRRVKIYPDMYMGSITKHTESFGKSKWISQNGAFLEQQLKDVFRDLAKATAQLIKKSQ